MIEEQIKGETLKHVKAEYKRKEEEKARKSYYGRMKKGCKNCCSSKQKADTSAKNGMFMDDYHSDHEDNPFGDDDDGVISPQD